jgi:hypothetical protein
MQKLDISALIARLIEFFPVGMVPQRMKVVYGKIVMMPVDERVIQSYVHIAFFEGIYKRSENVPAVGCIRNFEISMLTVPEAKTLVMFGRNGKILHSRPGRGISPKLRIIKIRVEMLKILAIIIVVYFFVILYPFMTGRQRIKPPVDKHSEPALDKPVRIGLAFSYIVHLNYLVNEILYTANKLKRICVSFADVFLR